jgi:hypothetical protein
VAGQRKKAASKHFHWEGSGGDVATQFRKCSTVRWVTRPWAAIRSLFLCPNRFAPDA